MTKVTQYGEISASVEVGGQYVADVTTGGLMVLGGRTYRFTDMPAAVAAVESYARRGHWTGEL